MVLCKRIWILSFASFTLNMYEDKKIMHKKKNEIKTKKKIKNNNELREVVVEVRLSHTLVDKLSSCVSADLNISSRFWVKMFIFDRKLFKMTWHIQSMLSITKGKSEKDKNKRKKTLFL